MRELVLGMAEVPGLIGNIAAGHDDTRLTYRPDPQTWSASDVLAHIRSCADVRSKWIAAMLDRDHPTLRAVSPRSAMRRYVGRDFAMSLREFSDERAALVARLRELDDPGWERGLTFTGASPGRTEQTIAGCAADLLSHERLHLTQLEDALRTP